MSRAWRRPVGMPCWQPSPARGQPVVPERVVIGPSPYPGTLGTDAANYYNVMITRDLAAPSGLLLTPNSAGTFGGAGCAGGP